MLLCTDCSNKKCRCHVNRQLSNGVLSNCNSRLANLTAALTLKSDNIIASHHQRTLVTMCLQPTLNIMTMVKTAQRYYVQITCFRENCNTQRSYVPLWGDATFVHSTLALTMTIYLHNHNNYDDVNKTWPYCNKYSMLLCHKEVNCWLRN